MLNMNLLKFRDLFNKMPLLIKKRVDKRPK